MDPKADDRPPRMSQKCATEKEGNAEGSSALHKTIAESVWKVEMSGPDGERRNESNTSRRPRGARGGRAPFVTALGECLQ